MKPEVMTIKGVKAFLKSLSVTIRIGKILRKEERNQHLSPYTAEQIQTAPTQPWVLESLRRTYRHYHIAYCQFRGTPREKIEPNTDNPPSEKQITAIMDEMSEVNPPKQELANAA